MKCLLKYCWVKLPRAQLPQGKGVLGYWSKLAARAAFRKGTVSYCGYRNDVGPGMWSGGIVGLKSILGVRRRAQALQIMDQLQSLGYIRYSLDQKTKRLDYQICDWVSCCSGQECEAGTVYATDGHGFLCLPRNITQRLVSRKYKFEEADALTVLKRKPDNGPKMYELIYQTYLAPEKLSHADLLYRLDISSRHYYRLRQQAITILSIRLWSAPSNEVDSWLEILTLLESL